MKKITNEKKKKYNSNKATLVAAAIMVTAATGLGTYAATSSDDSSQKTTQSSQNSVKSTLSYTQKAGLDQARKLFKAGKEDEAKALLDSLNLDDLDFVPKFEMKLNFTEAQKAALEEAKKMKSSGDIEGAKKVLEDAGIPMPPFGHFGPPPMMSEEAIAALEAGDFEAWKTAVTAENPNAKILDEIDETKFKAMVEAHKAMEDGDFETAKKISEEAGIKGPFMHKEFHFMENNLTDEQKTRLDEAHKLLEAGDEEGAKAIFKELNLPFPENFMIKMELTEAEKTRLQEAKQLMKEDKTDEAKAIFDELGLEPPMKGFRLDMMNLTDEQKEGLKKADDLRASGDEEGAKTLMDSLNLPKPKERAMMWLNESEMNSEETNENEETTSK